MYFNKLGRLPHYNKGAGMKCKLCGEQIPTHHVQQGGMHMDCFASPQELWEVALPDDPKNSYIATSMDCVQAMVAESDDGMLVKSKTMTAGEYAALPDFKGF